MSPLQTQLAFSWLDRILQADKWLLLKINRDWHHPLADSVALVIRESVAHAPLYLFIILFMVINFGTRGLWWIIGAAALAGVSDLVSSHVIKDLFDRPRPCRSPETAHQIRFIARYCGMNGSFISSHASNHFALASFIWYTLGYQGRHWKLFMLWAASICYAQVYVGVHYPSDVIFGAAVGICLGWMASRIYVSNPGLTMLPS